MTLTPELYGLITAFFVAIAGVLAYLNARQTAALTVRVEEAKQKTDENKSHLDSNEGLYKVLQDQAASFRDMLTLQAKQDADNREERRVWHDGMISTLDTLRQMSVAFAEINERTKNISSDVKAQTALITADNAAQNQRMDTMSQDVSGLQSALKDFEKIVDGRFETLQNQLSDERMKALLEATRLQLVEDVKQIITDAIASLHDTGSLAGKAATGPDEKNAPTA